mgnify:CR=1 FL=1
MESNSPWIFDSTRRLLLKWGHFSQGASPSLELSQSRSYLEVIACTTQVIVVEKGPDRCFACNF